LRFQNPKNTQSSPRPRETGERGRGCGGDTPHTPHTPHTPTHTNTHQHASLSAMCSGWKARATKRTHPRTPVRGSPNRTPNTLPPLAPVKRGRGVGGEGATPHTPTRTTVSNVLGLESPSYEKNPPADSRPQLAKPNTEHSSSPRPRETGESDGLCVSQDGR